MDRLLVIDPNELIFDFELGQRCSSFVTLKNVMFTMPVAFKIALAPPQVPGGKSKYTMKPAQGIIPPAGRVTVEIILSPQSSLPEYFPVSADKFIVKSLVVPGGSHHGGVSGEWFESKKNFIYNDSGLKAIFKGACIIEALLASGSMEQVREVLELGVDLNRPLTNGRDRPLLHSAIESGRPEMVQLLLEFGAEPEARDKSGKTPLHEAAASGQSLIAELLLANGADPTVRTDPIGWTALHFAAHAQHPDMVRVLLAHRSSGEIINAPAGPEKLTPLHLAAAAGDAACLKLLLDTGAANVHAVASDGRTALHVAALAADVGAVRLLVQHGAVRGARDRDGHLAYDAAAEALSGGTPRGSTELLDVLKLGDELRRAARKGDAKGVRAALKHGARINGGDQNGWTALHCASFKGHLEVVKLLVERCHADVNSVDREGYSALMCAVETGNCDVARYLMARGADLNLRSKKGVSAAELGALMGEETAAKLLTDGGARSMMGFSSVESVNAKQKEKLLDGDGGGGDTPGKMRRKKEVSRERFGSRKMSFNSSETLLAF